MTLRIVAIAALMIWAAVGSVSAQTEPWRGAPAVGRPGVAPGHQPAPRGVASRPTQPQAPRAPFQLTPRDQANLDWVLNTWEQRSEKVKTLRCGFTRWEYDPVFGDPNKASFIDEGSINYRAPDKGQFYVERPKERQERWVSDGRSIYQYNFANKQLIQHKLPPALQGKAIVESPLPFIFGAEAAKLKQRYFLRIITPPDVQDRQIWLEAYPRRQADAANFRRAELILTKSNMVPHALQIYAPNGQNRTVYQFRDIMVNDPLDFLKNPFHVLTPPFWKKIVEEPAETRVGRQPGPVAR